WLRVDQPTLPLRLPVFWRPSTGLAFGSKPLVSLRRSMRSVRVRTLRCEARLPPVFKLECRLIAQLQIRIIARRGIAAATARGLAFGGPDGRRPPPRRRRPTAQSATGILP